MVLVAVVAALLLGAVLSLGAAWGVWGRDIHDLRERAAAVDRDYRIAQDTVSRLETVLGAAQSELGRFRAVASALRGQVEGFRRENERLRADNQRLRDIQQAIAQSLDDSEGALNGLTDGIGNVEGIIRGVQERGTAGD